MALSAVPLPPARVGEFYSVVLASYISGGVAPYYVLYNSHSHFAVPQFSVTPNTGGWLSLNFASGVLSGLPQVSEQETIFAFSVTDSSGLATSLTWTLNVSTSTAQPYLALITSEHNQKLNFMSVVQTLCAGVADSTAVINAIPLAYNLFTAQGAQLDTVGQWIGQGRVVSSVITVNFFGFCELPTSGPAYPTGGTPDSTNIYTFGELTNPSYAVSGVQYAARFYNLGETYTASTVLADPEYRTVLQALVGRNQYNTSNVLGLVAQLEQALLFIFGVPCQVLDYGTYSITVSIPAAAATAVDLALITTLDILPRPAGVKIVVTTH